MFKVIILFVYLYLYLQNVECAKILGVFTMPSISHQIVFQPIWKELSLRGHQVTVLTPNPLNDPRLVNLTEIDLGFTYENKRKDNVQASLQKDLPMIKIIASFYKMFRAIDSQELEHPAVQALIQDTSKTFDVLLVEFLHPTMGALSARFNCPMIGITSLGVLIDGHDAVGNPSHPVINPDILLPFVGSLGFFERLYSTYFVTWFRYYYHYTLLPEADKVARQYVSDDIPYLGDIQQNVNMLFLNVNPILYPVRANVPAVIEVGNMHMQSKDPLPADIQKELNAASEGVIYFSLGSNVRSTNLSTEVREKIVEALSELPYKVFWKWEDDHLPGKPKNVVIRKWFPQRGVLSHPNIKVFLTQGGLQSIEEAISNGVPLVGMPFYADQPRNVMKMVNLDIAQAVDPEKFTKEELKAALIEVAEDFKYRNKVRQISKLISDVPMTGLDKAIWWTEYVIRHKGARHLRSLAVDMPWHQYLLLDVFGFVFGVTLIAIFVLYKTASLSIKIAKKYLLQQRVKLW